MNKTTSQILQIIMAKGVVTVDAKTKMTSDLIRMAQVAAINNVNIRIINASSKLTTQLIDIARAGNGKVIFVDAL